ncbi:hypothetical protein BKA70DRAFT_1507805 [Coprinopsis sp. MPI-PUGE-AT-0042]|nr:hypothetical protein BKA70DRAFT_1507805 [Coprinopsis sp. MPI-PUGE-AT-0042]
MADPSPERAQTPAPFVATCLTSIPEGPPETPSRTKENQGSPYPATPPVQNTASNVLKQRGVFPTLAAIKKYLDISSLFDKTSQRWHKVPQAPKAESELYEPFGHIFDEIIHYFKLGSEELGSHDQPKLPDFVVTGFDERFSRILENKNEPEYAATVSVSRPSSINTSTPVEDHHAQMGVYTRQIFNAQANRNFVRSAVFSEHRVSLLHFDRSGLKHSELFDIHEHAVDFVRIVLGLVYPAPKVLGFDETITFEWVDNEDGRPERCGFVNTFDGNDLTGRGTTCWDIIAIDDDGNEVVYLMKESWRTETRPAEQTFLEIAKGLEGVGQIISWEELVHTAELRGLNARNDVGFNNRVKCRTVLEKYGGPVHEFQTELELFCAFKDAIRGHRALLHRKVLHRDVSINNILLGKPNASEGWRGVLIDLDMAIMIDRDPKSIAADIRTGTRITTETVRHDYCDDLESFFYVFGYILFTFASPGKQKAIPETLEQWDADKPYVSLTSKLAFVTSDAERHLMEDVSPSWWTLEEKDNSLSGARANGHYDELDAIFQTAIDDASNLCNTNQSPGENAVPGPSIGATVPPQAAASMATGKAAKLKKPQAG